MPMDCQAKVEKHKGCPCEGHVGGEEAGYDEGRTRRGWALNEQGQATNTPWEEGEEGMKRQLGIALVMGDLKEVGSIPSRKNTESHRPPNWRHVS